MNRFHRHPLVWLALAAWSVALVGVAAPYLGLGADEKFILYARFGLARGELVRGAALFGAALLGAALLPAAVGLLRRLADSAFAQRCLRMSRSATAVLRNSSLRRRIGATLVVAGVIAASVAGVAAIDRLYGALVSGRPAATGAVSTIPGYAYNPSGQYVRLHAMETAAYERSNYRSFVTWGYRDYRSEFVNVVDGVRQTRQPPRRPGLPTRVVWFFGGSTLLGQGSDDGNTIPAHACRYLARLWPATNWHCVNFGVGGYVGTQEVVQLVRELRDHPDRRPDVVVFYDGVNDFIAALHGFPGEHHEFEVVREKLGRRIDLPPDTRPGVGDHAPAMDILGRLAHRELRALANRYFPNIMSGLAEGSQQAPSAPAALAPDAEKVMERVRAAGRYYNGNRALCRTVFRNVPFRVIFAFQPTVFSAKRDVAEEAPLLQRPFVGFRYAHLMQRFWDALHETVAEDGFADVGSCRSVDLSAAFAEERRQVFFDWMHVFPLGNQRVGHALAREIAGSAAPAGYDAVSFDAATLVNGDVDLRKPLR